MSTIAEGTRKALLAKIHMGKSQLRWDEERFMAVKAGLTGKESCAEMSLKELEAVLETMRREGFKEVVKRKGRTIDPSQNTPQQSQVFRLWYVLAAHQKCSRSTSALNAWLKRQVGVDRIEWLTHPVQCRSAIEGLKAWCKREGIRIPPNPLEKEGL